LAKAALTAGASAVTSWLKVAPYFAAHGVPVCRKSKMSVIPHSRIAVTKRLLSLPPMPMVTTVVAALSARSWIGASACCAVAVGFAVVAPLQLTARTPQQHHPQRVRAIGAH
jgi:hypothetical protein